MPRPRVENTEGEVLGVDVPSPRFSFEPLGGQDRNEEQTHYQLVVIQKRFGKIFPIWDSGVVASNRSQYLAVPPSVTFPRDARCLIFIHPCLRHAVQIFQAL